MDIGPATASASTDAGHLCITNAKDLGLMITRRRQAMGLNMADAAALCNVGTRFLFDLEHGKPTLEFNRTLRVAQRFGIDLFAVLRS